MKKYPFLLLSIFIIPSFVFALSIYPLTPRDVDPTPDASSCVSLQNNLRYRSKDVSTSGEVSTLQDFLQSQNYLTGEPTGYFGLLTFKGVKDFQSVNSISPTGYVGPATRAKIALLTCDGNTSTSLTPTTSDSTNRSCAKEYIDIRLKQKYTLGSKMFEPNEGGTVGDVAGGNYLEIKADPSRETMIFTISDVDPAKTAPTPGALRSPIEMESIKLSNACEGLAKIKSTPTSACPSSGFDSRTGFRCGCNSNTEFSTTTGERCNSNTKVVISGISGPQSLSINQTGTWTIKASSQSGGNLSYGVNWGDENMVTPYQFSAPREQQSATFSHAYSNYGTYKPVFTVTNSSGQSAQTSLSVNVSLAPTSSYPPGCTSSSGFSPITGEPCNTRLTIKLAASATSVNLGERITIGLIASHVTQCFGPVFLKEENANTVNLPTFVDQFNSTTTLYPQKTRTYSASCKNNLTGESASEEVTVTVKDNTPSVTPTPVINNFFADPVSILLGTSSKLNFLASGADSCNVSGFTSAPTTSGSVLQTSNGAFQAYFKADILGNVSGTMTVRPVSLITYTVNCIKLGGNVGTVAHPQYTTSKSVSTSISVYPYVP